MAANRKTLRSDLKAYLAPLMTALQSQDDFFAYEPADYKGRSPVVFLSAAGSEHSRHTPKAIDSDFYITVHLLALWADMNGGVYTESAAADLLDDLENQLTTAIEAKPANSGKWQFIEFDGRSVADEPQQVGGDVYLHEVITLRVRLF